MATAALILFSLTIHLENLHSNAEWSQTAIVSSTRIKPPVYVNHTVHVNLKYAYEQTFAVTGAFEQSADVV